MRVEHQNGRVYIVNWMYRKVPSTILLREETMRFEKINKRKLTDEELNNLRKMIKDVMQTVCILKVLNEENNAAVIAEGVAEQSIVDTFNKNKGRKVSLLKALKQIFNTPVDRLTFWESYFRMRNGSY